MTWKELKEEIERFTEEQQAEQVCTWGADVPFGDDIKLCVAKENFYCHPDWEYSCTESSLDEEDKNNDECYVICEKGKHYLYNPN